MNCGAKLKQDYSETGVTTYANGVRISCDMLARNMDLTYISRQAIRI